MSRSEQLVHDELEPCPYLEGQQARMPLRWQTAPVLGETFDDGLAQGERRVGPMLYRTACPSCRACEPLRLPVSQFRASRSQRRTLRRNGDVRVSIGAVKYSDEKLNLYNRHKLERGLSKDEVPMTREGYLGWFARSCTHTVEMRYHLDSRLVGVGIVDVGEKDTSSVYFFFDPDQSARSLGTFSVLTEVAWQQQRGGRYHYLGLYVSETRHLSYKARFHPHHRLIDGIWTPFDKRATT